MLFNEPKLLKSRLTARAPGTRIVVSVLFNEPKLLKFVHSPICPPVNSSFSALQRAEIAEIRRYGDGTNAFVGFSALQRAEIAEMLILCKQSLITGDVSVLFNEPKLLK